MQPAWTSGDVVVNVTPQRSGHRGQEEPALPGWSAGRRNAPSRPHEGAARARGTFSRTQLQRRGGRDAEVPALNQLISQKSANATRRIAGVESWRSSDER